MRYIFSILLMSIALFTFGQRNKIESPNLKVCEGVYITTYAYGPGYSLASSYFAPATTMGLLTEPRTSNPWHAPCFPIPYSKSDYANTGYDIGHFIPYKILAFNDAATMESFSLGNASPQQRDFNERVWEGSEMRILDVISQLGDCSIICGAIYDKNPKTVGPDKLPVATYYFKVCYFKNHGMIGIIGNNTTEAMTYVTTDQIEQLYKDTMGIDVDLFSDLDKETQLKLEAVNIPNVNIITRK